MLMTLCPPTPVTVLLRVLVHRMTSVTKGVICDVHPESMIQDAAPTLTAGLPRFDLTLRMAEYAGPDLDWSLRLFGRSQSSIHSSVPFVRT